LFLNTFFEGSTGGRFTIIKDAFSQSQLFEMAKLYCFSFRKGPVSNQFDNRSTEIETIGYLNNGKFVSIKYFC
jgi:hypothetical protein